MITSEIAVAFTQCRLKAYYLLCSNKRGISHEYTSILEEEANKNRERYLSTRKAESSEAKRYSIERMNKRTPVLYAALTHVSNIQEIAGTYSVSEKLFSHKKRVFDLVMRFGTSKSPKRITRSKTRFSLAFLL